MTLASSIDRPQASAYIAGLCALACYSLALFPALRADWPMLGPAGLVAGTIILWATGLVAESLTALLFFTVAMLGRVAPPEIVFSGFVSSAFWLIFAGLVIGAAVKESGLGDRLAARLAVLMGRSFRTSLAGSVIFGLAMSFIMPSTMGRVILILPILTALATHLGHERNSKGYLGLTLGGVFGTFLPSFSILPANIPNNVMAGIVETRFKHPLAFGDYLLLHFPVLGFLKALVLIAVLLLVYRGVAENRPAERGPAFAPMSRAERHLSLVLALALSFWLTDTWHHISPAWIGMAAAIACLFPGFGILPPKALQRINLEPSLYVGAIVGIGGVVVQSGLGQHLAALVRQVLVLEPGAGASNFAQLGAMSTILGLVATLPGQPAVLTPLAPDFAGATGLPVDAILITQVIGFSTVLLPYEAPPLVLAMGMADLPRRDTTRICLLTAFVTVVALWPLDYLWVSALGRF